jgi:hypothetical protein
MAISSKSGAYLIHYPDELVNSRVELAACLGIHMLTAYPPDATWSAYKMLRAMAAGISCTGPRGSYRRRGAAN